MIDLVADLNAFDEERLNAEPLACELLAKRAASRISALEAENERLRDCLISTRHEICLGPVDDTLWHTEMPACTTVDNICLTLGDDWSYDDWIARAKGDG